MRLEPRPEPTIGRLVAAPAAAVAATAVVAGLLVAAAGASPFTVFWQILKGAAGSQFALFETLTRATPLIFTGLAVAVAFRAKLWNIGAEAQLYAGAVITVVLGTGAMPLPSYAVIPVSMGAAAACGAAVLYGPAFLKTRFGVDEVVTTLLLNFIALLAVSMLLDGVLKDPMGLGWPQSEHLAREARLPRLAEGKRLHVGFLMAIAFAGIVWAMMSRTVLGYEMRAAGHNSGAARFLGIPVESTLLKTALISGGLAALAGYSEVAGTKGNLTLDLSPGFGYTGIVVAMLAMLNPLGVVPAAIFVAGIFVGADAMSRTAGVPSFIADVVVATALLTMVVAIMTTRYRIRRG